uniref:E3 ubiquitin-protein ligase DTX1-like isoform X1 n=1 Tax=Myxine glutinosa TaxID=7769 RepID=UPI00358EEE92
MRPVRRSLFEPASAPGRGVVWEWEAPGGRWTPYPVEVTVAVQNAYEKQHPWLDLAPLGLPVVLDFTAMCQVERVPRGATSAAGGGMGRRSRLRRRLDAPYPLLVVGGGPGGAPALLPPHPLPKSQSWPVGGSASVGPTASCPCSQCRPPLRSATTALPTTLSRPAASCATVTLQAAPSSPPVGCADIAQRRRETFSSPSNKTQVRVAVPSVPRPRSQPVLHSVLGAGSSNVLGAGNCVPPSISAPNNLNRPAGKPHRPALGFAGAIRPPGVPALPVKNLGGSGPVNPALAGMTGILLAAAALPVFLTRAPRPVLHPPAVGKADLRPVFGVPGSCRKLKKKHTRRGRSAEEVVKKFLQKLKNPPDEDCTICMERLTISSGYEVACRPSNVRPEAVGRLGRCGHSFHLLCMLAMYSNGNKDHVVPQDGSLQCPTCKTIYGQKTGSQPPGKMEFHVIPYSLPGHPEQKTIRIIYDIPPGIQGPEHQNPGKKFTARGFPRHCYLPDNEKGRLALRLLIIAWERRLIFTVGTSSTTGEIDTVVWNEIHHKTEFGSNVTGHGYPDPNYLDNVLAELAAQGVQEPGVAE